MKSYFRTLIILAIMIVCVIPRYTECLPFMKFDSNNILYDNEYKGIINNQQEQIENENIKPSENMDNLLYIPFNETIINEFGAHKYIINRNIKTLIDYKPDSFIVNEIFNSISFSADKISHLIMNNRARFDNMSDNQFISDFLDFWCAYRIIQLAESDTNNLDVLINILKGNF